MHISFTVDDIPHILVILALAAVIGYLADLLAGGRVPLGFFGSILSGMLGAWVSTDVVRSRLPLSLSKEPALDGVMLVTAAIGAFIFSMLWCVLASRVARR
ncbi:MAG: hypothetical protein M3014_03685 [Chloroflexota bacterium]|nr:hypothetical protein [Chloroflexota bacterium]